MQVKSTGAPQPIGSDAPPVNNAPKNTWGENRMFAYMAESMRASIFSTADANHDRKLSRGEWNNNVGLIWWAKFESVDNDGKGGVSFDELNDAFRELQALAKNFMHADSDRNGNLNRTEWSAAKLDQKIGKFKDVDADHKKSVSLLEFLNAPDLPLNGTLGNIP